MVFAFGQNEICDHEADVRAKIKDASALVTSVQRFWR